MMDRAVHFHDFLNALAAKHGFAAAGVCALSEPPRFAEYLAWLNRGEAGEMDYMHRHQELRRNPSLLLEGAKSVICFAMNYHLRQAPSSSQKWHKGAKAGTPRIAMYALGRDYHKLLRKKLRSIVKELDPVTQPFRDADHAAAYRICVDSAPIIEREYAALAGIGWIGKNGCIIHPKQGSWLLLGEILTTVALPPSSPRNDHCGRCRACIDACPTGALYAPYKLDSRRCISYLTIEKRGPFTAEQEKMVGELLFGCDICQSACPWNRRAPAGFFYNDRNPVLDERLNPDLDRLSFADRQTFDSHFAGSALRRPGWNGWQRNLDAVRRNGGSHSVADTRR